MLEKKFQINNLSLYHKKLKKEQIKSKVRKRKGKSRSEQKLMKFFKKNNEENQ